MTTYTIPFTYPDQRGAFVMTVNLDGVDFRLSFQYNSREGFWYFDLLDSSENVLRAGIKVVSNFPLLLRFRDVETRPEGELVSIDTRREPEDPGLSDLQVTSVFSYVDADEIAEATG